MKNYRVIEHLAGSIEEEFQGCKIFIENNPDSYRGGFEWSVCKDDEMWDSGLAVTIENAVSEAQNSIAELNRNRDYMLATSILPI